jgi:hypothetical protein
MGSDSFNDIIQKISNILTDACQEKWDSIEIIAEIFNEYSRFTMTSTNDEKVDSVVLSEEQSLIIDDLFRNLQIVTKKDDMEFWNQAVFNLQTDGNFNIDFSYAEGS